MENVSFILEFINNYLLYAKLIIIIAIIFHCIYKRYDKLSKKYRSKAFAILIFAYLFTDFSEGLIRKFYVNKNIEIIHNNLNNKIDSVNISLNEKIDITASKIYDDYNINPKTKDSSKQIKHDTR